MAGLEDNGTVDGEDADELINPEVVVLEDEDGNAHEFALLQIVDVDEKEYALMTLVEQLDDDESESMDLYLFRYEELEGDMASFSEIEDDETYARVRDYCATLVDDLGDVEIEVEN